MGWPQPLMWLYSKYNYLHCLVQSHCIHSQSLVLEKLYITQNTPITYCFLYLYKSHIYDDELTKTVQ